MDWTGGYAARWLVSRVDADTWEDAEALDGVLSVTVERDCTDDVPLLESGSIEVDGDVGSGERWLRVSMVADQGGTERVDVATLLFAASGCTTDHRAPRAALDGWSVLKPAADVTVPVGAYAPRGSDGAQRAAALIAACTPAPVEVEGGFTLCEHVVFDPGSSCLEAAWALLRAGGFCIQIDGRGCIHVRELPRDPALELDAAHAALLLPEVSDELDLSGVPNRYIAVEGRATAEAVNDDPASPVSFAARGRWVDARDGSPMRVNGESLESYAARMLAQASTAVRRRTYTREWWPDVLPFSVVRGGLASVGLEGDMRVVAQSLTCGAGVTVSETAEQEVRLWQ